MKRMYGQNGRMGDGESADIAELVRTSAPSCRPIR